MNVSRHFSSGLVVGLLMLIFVFSTGRARAVDQWATGVVAYSSQAGVAVNSAHEAVGLPDTFAYGDYSTAWSPASVNGTTEWIALSFDVPVFANGATIRETCGNGFVKQIDVIDTNNVLHTVWTGVDKSKAGVPVNFKASWTQTNYPVRVLKVTISTNKNLSTREEIDAVQLSGEPAHGPVDEWATDVIDYSSQSGATYWSANQALGPPDTESYGDRSTAWAPSKPNGTLEHITLQFPAPLYSTGVTIRESCGNGFVYQIDAVDMAGALHTVWSGTDPTAPGALADFNVSWAQTAFMAKGIRIYVNTSHDPGNWEEIDAVQLHGVTSNFADLILSPASTVGGKAVSGQLYLFGPAPPGGLVLSLSSANPSLAAVPSSVTIAEGATAGTFPIVTAGVAATTKIIISAALTLGDTQSATLTLTPAALSSVSLTPADQTGGLTVTGKVTLSGFAPAGGATVSLANTNTAASLPGGTSVVVPEGANTATFTINTVPVVALVSGTISATYRAVAKSAVLDVIPPDVSKVTLSPTSLKGGTVSTATVVLTGMTAEAIVVNVASGTPSVAYPVDSNGNPITTVTVPGATDRITFRVQTKSVTTSTTVLIGATLGGTTKTTKLTVKP